MADIANMDAIKKEIASLVGAAPETLDTLAEVAAAIQENETVVDALNAAIGNKADTAALDSLTGRVNTLENKTTAVSFTQSLTSGTKIGVLYIDNEGYNIFAPTAPTLASLMGSSAIGGASQFIYWTGSAWGKKSLGDIAFKNSLSMSEIDDRPTNLSHFVDDVVSGNYLPIVGGTIKGDLRIQRVNNSGQNLNFGSGLYFGDGEYCCLYEDEDDHLTIVANSGISLVVGTYGSVTVNGNAILTSADLTKANVGLGNVENTKLSTWEGSTYINTLGTITSGTWNGSKIANSYLANSAMTIAGQSVSLGGSITAATLKSKLGLSANDTPTFNAIKIGEATITWDAQKGALKIDKPIYSTSGVAAKGPELVE